MPEMGQTICPYVLTSTPAVLSVGKRCQSMGYSFLWITGMPPVFITPSKTAVVLKIVYDIPYLYPGDPESMERPLDIGNFTGDVFWALRPES